MPISNVSETNRQRWYQSDVTIGLSLVIFTILLRSGIILGLRSELTVDIDAYLAIAQEIVAGNGFATPETGRPTAFRPPLYPLLLAGWLTIGPAAVGVAILHVLFSAGTVWLTYFAGLRLMLSKFPSALAGLFIACDPLLARYAALPMTETLATFLASGLLFLSFGSDRKTQIIRGICFGLAVLCRPTFWVFGGFAMLAWITDAWRNRSKSPLRCLVQQVPWITVLAVAVVVLPWVVRNTIVLGRPILMTTHGGYTLLLGNNATFAREVVEQPFGTVWEGESLRRWQASLEQDMSTHGIATDDEFARDRYLRDRAVRFIRREPGTFFRASWLRFRRFWGIDPPASAVEAIGRLWTRFTGNVELVPMVQNIVRWSVRLFYGLLFLAAIIGGYRMIRRPDWHPVFWLIVSLMLVHLVYWSNARMRAPTMPAITLLAASVFHRQRSENTDDERTSVV